MSLRKDKPILNTCWERPKSDMECRCAGRSMQQGNAVTSKFVVIFSSSSWLITQHVVVVVNLAKYRVIISK